MTETKTSRGRARTSASASRLSSDAELRSHAASPAPEKDRGEISCLLVAWREGDAEAEEKLVQLVYDHLKRVARGYLRRDSARRSLQTTEIVHEAYLRLVAADLPFQDSNHFYVVAARSMRRFLVDEARKNAAVKRRGALEELPLLESDFARQEEGGDSHYSFLELDEALRELWKLDSRKVKVIELRCFAGLSIAETSKILEISTATVERDLRLGKAWLGQRVLP